MALEAGTKLGHYTERRNQAYRLIVEAAASD